MNQPVAANTLERIAELAGVSRSTVSRVLNNDAHVKAATRQRVLEVVEQEGYVPNRTAQGLASGRTGMIGVVISIEPAHVFTDPFFPILLEATYGSARVRELVLSLWLLEDELDRKTMNQIARGSILDGAIVAAGTTNDPIVKELSASNKPFVLLGRPAHDPDLSFIDVDNRSAVRNATGHLHRLGRNRVAMISGPETSVAGIDRKAGYLDALAAAGIEPNPDLVFEADWTAATAGLAVRRLMQHEPDALFIANDTMAIAAMAELAAMGVRVPDDVAVVGFDDLPAARNANPPLTTIRQSIRLLASEAVRVLSDLIEDPSLPPQQVLIPTELIVRESCGANVHARRNSAKKGDR